jgi:hypothetical protein
MQMEARRWSMWWETRQAIRYYQVSVCWAKPRLTRGRGKTYCETLGEVDLVSSENVYYLAVGRKSGTGCPKSNWTISGILPYNMPLRFGIFLVYLFEYLGNPEFLSSLSSYSKFQLNIQLGVRTQNECRIFCPPRERVLRTGDAVPKHKYYILQSWKPAGTTTDMPKLTFLPTGEPFHAPLICNVIT